jgi:N-acetylneuraminic acid mutarotase
MSPFSTVLAGSVWEEDAADFSQGTLDKTTVRGDALQLEKVTISDDWYLVSEGWPEPMDGPAHGYDPDGEMLVFGGYGGSTWTFNIANKTWYCAKSPSSPEVRFFSAMAYSTQAKKYVLFGGGTGMDSFNIDTSLNDTWVFDPSTGTWTEVMPATSPPARHHHEMVYDPVNDVFILFGGPDDTWTYDIGTNIWTQRGPTATPGPRSGHGMVYVDSLQAALVFGDGTDTWYYDYENDTWKDLMATYSGEAYREIAMAYDKENDQVLMKGGEGGLTGNQYTWSYDVEDNTWTNLDLSPEAPSDNSPAMIYDVNDELVVLFGGGASRSSGGVGGPPPGSSQTWIFNISAQEWSRVNDSPDGRSSHGMVYVPTLDAIFLYGVGRERHTYRGGALYHIGDMDWERITNNNDMVDRKRFGMAYDSKDDRVVVFGGYRPSSSSGREHESLGDMWVIDMVGKTWSRITPGASPGKRCGISMVYHTGSDKFIIFGGNNEWSTRYYNDTWVYDPQLNLWTNMSPPTGPSKRSDYGMVFIESTAEILLYGGQDENKQNMSDVWFYNLTQNSWRQQVTTYVPTPRYSPALDYDLLNDHVVMFGGAGGGLLDDTLIYDITAADWSLLDVAIAPSMRAGSRMVYSPSREGHFLFGGGGPNRTLYCDTWVFNFEGFERDGAYTSEPYDMNGTAYFGNISWIADVPSKTEVRFQVRTAGDLSELATKEFVGPDGSAGTFYETNDTRLNDTHNGTSFIQYRALLDSLNPFVTPSIKKVGVTYNLMHSIEMVYPVGGENLSGVQNITWSTEEKDDDTIHYKVIVESVSENFTLVNDTTDNVIDPWNTSAYSNGQYRVRVIGWDDNEDIPLSNETLSDWFEIYNAPPNTPPSSRLLFPENNSVINLSAIDLGWEGEDDENDTLMYRLYINESLDDLMVLGTGIETSNTTYNFSKLGTYYWTVIPDDGKVNGTCFSGIWKFTLAGEPPPPPVNHPPSVTLVAPEDGFNSSMRNVTLEWNGTDVDNDTLSYYVLLGPVRSSVLNLNVNYLLENTTNTTSIVTLDEGTYFWTVIPFDGKINGTANITVWSFNVSLPHPSVTCVITDPASGTHVNGTIEIEGQATAVDTDLVVVKVRVDGGEWMNATGTSDWTHQLDTKEMADGDHTIEVQAVGGDAESDIQSIVIMVKNKKVDTSMEAPLWPWILAIIIAVIVVIVIVYYYNYRKQREGKEGEEEEEKEEEEKEGNDEDASDPEG